MEFKYQIGQKVKFYTKTISSEKVEHVGTINLLYDGIFRLMKDEPQYGIDVEINNSTNTKRYFITESRILEVL